MLEIGIPYPVGFHLKEVMVEARHLQFQEYH
jgi:hypothetical protein